MMHAVLVTFMNAVVTWFYFLFLVCASWLTLTYAAFILITGSNNATHARKSYSTTDGIYINAWRPAALNVLRVPTKFRTSVILASAVRESSSVCSPTATSLSRDIRSARCFSRLFCRVCPKYHDDIGR